MPSGMPNRVSGTAGHSCAAVSPAATFCGVKALSLNLMSPRDSRVRRAHRSAAAGQRAVDLARRLGFANSCRPEHGRLLYALAAGAGTIGETGTGCGVGLAWLASGARPGTRLVSVEIDTERAGLVASLFADLPHVAVLPGDWREIYRAAPFDLLVLDGGGQGRPGVRPEEVCSSRAAPSSSTT